MNSYASLADFKGGLIANVSTTGQDVRLRELLEAVSRVVEEYIGRHIYSFTATRYFSGNGLKLLTLPWDLIAITTLKEDTVADAVYDTTWAAADYVLSSGVGNYDADPTGRAHLANTRPYWTIEVDERSTGSKSRFRWGQRVFELAGKFGFSESTVDSTATTNEAFDATDVTLTVSDGTAFSVGQTILIDSEQLYITAISTNALTVVRGVNGTTAAAHDTATAISIIEYPNPIREAVLLEAGLLLETRGYRRQLGNFDTGIITPFGRTFSAETKTKLDPFKLVRT